jgi:hypothetical protein
MCAKRTSRLYSLVFWKKMSDLHVMHALTDIPLKSTSRIKAHLKFIKNHPLLQRNTMGRADKLAQVTKAVLVIRSGEYIDYSNTINKFYYSRTAVIRRITGQTKTRQKAHSFWH